MKTIKPLLEYIADYAPGIPSNAKEKFAIIDMLEDLKNAVNANTEQIEKLMAVSQFEKGKE